jgi:hypothetical protein
MSVSIPTAIRVPNGTLTQNETQPALAGYPNNANPELICQHPHARRFKAVVGNIVVMAPIPVREDDHRRQLLPR